MRFNAAEQMEENPDFLIILKAVWDGLLGKGNVSIDARLYTEQAMEALKELGLQEKPSAPDFSLISLKMKGWSERFATEVSHPGEIHDQPIQNHSIAEKFKIKFHEGEFLKNSIHNLGSMLVKAGKRMQKK